MSEAAVTTETRGPAARITLRRPVIGAAEIQALQDACAAASDDSNVRAIVLTGTGDVFASDWDFDGSKVRHMHPDPFGCFADSPKPVLCALNGDAMSSGLALALAADVRLAAHTAHFGLPEAGIGTLPTGGSIERLARLVGRGKALEMILTGESIDAEEALRIGLVSEVVDDVRVRAQEIAELLATRGPVALQYAKEAVNRGIDMPLEQALRFETDLTVLLQTTEDRAEGVRAFMEKRKPDFKGR